MFFVCTVCAAEQVDACPEVTDVVEENDAHGTADDAGQPVVEESYDDDGPAAGDVVSAGGSVHSVTSGPPSQSATAPDEVEMNQRDEESPKQSARDADESITMKTLTKPNQSSTKTGNSRTKNAASKCAEKKAWKPGGSLVALPSQQNRKEAWAAGRGKSQRQGNASVPPRLPPISVSAVGNSDRRKQQPAAGEAARHASNGFTAGRGVGINAAPGHVYKCSATACVTVLAQTPENNQHPSTNGADELSNGTADFSKGNRKYSS